MMTGLIAALLVLGGVVAAAYGVALWSVPAAWILGGFLLVWMGVSLERWSTKRK